jgi:hypothetical protein
MRNNHLWHYSNNFSLQLKMSEGGEFAAVKYVGKENDYDEGWSDARSVAKNYFKDKEKAAIAEKVLLEQEDLIRRKKEDAQKDVDEKLAKKVEFQKRLAAFQDIKK